MAGVLADADGRVLVAQRPSGKHMAGRWEFPGGKLHEGEAPLVGLARELSEELGIELRQAEPLIRLHYDYPDRRVLLDVWRVSRYDGVPRPLDRQALDWVRPDDLPRVDLLEADRPIITALRLAPVARCAAGLHALQAAASRNGPEVIFWRPDAVGAHLAAAAAAVGAARRAGHRVLVTGDGVEAVTTAAATGADGLLLEPDGVEFSIDRHGAFMVGVLCPTPEVALEAAQAGAHFLVLAGERGPDELKFDLVLPQLGLPAYLGWYRDEQAMERARAHGAHGCAIGPCD